MRSFRSFALSAVIAFSVIATSIQPAHAILPVVVAAVARQAVAITAENITLGIIAKGFAANDPYIRTTATLPRKTLATRLAGLRAGKWSGAAKMALAIGAALGLDVLYDSDTGFYQSIPYDPNVVGYCTYGYGYTGTLQACLNSYKPYGVIGVSRSVYNGKDTVFYFARSDGSESANFYLYGQKAEPTKTPLTADDINRALVGVSSNSDTWGDYLAGLDEASLNKLLDGADIPAYNPTNPTPELAQLKDWYRQGLLQTTNPDAPYYVTPEQLAEIKKAVEAEDALNTDDGLIEDLNSKIKQPLTQTQFEESNKKFSDAVDSVTNSVGSENDFSDIDEHFNKLDDFITDIPNSELPSAASVNFPKYVSCRQLHLTDGKGRELIFPNESQCAKLEDVKQGFGYFLYVLCVFGLVWQLLTRPTGG